MLRWRPMCVILLSPASLSAVPHPRPSSRLVLVPAPVSGCFSRSRLC
jgi:hypothetical protein